jgi:predicted DsbA family dithiol-disulfide isomerase
VVAERRLVVFEDYACPFCYLAEAALSRLRREHAVTVESAAFELRPPGTPLPSMDEPWLREQWERLVAPAAASLGLEPRFPPLPVRTRKAHEAAAYARSEGAFAPLHEAVYRAYWEEGRDIGRIDVLVGIGESVGLEPWALKVALDIDQWTEQVSRDRALSAQLGVTGVPAYVLYAADAACAADAVPAASLPVAGELRMGMQLYDELRAWVVPDDV